MVDAEVATRLQAIQSAFLLTLPEEEEDEHRIREAGEGQIGRLLDHAGCDLPPDYLDFLRYSDGFLGDLERVSEIVSRPLADDGGYRSYVARLMPGCLVIGGNGGGDYYCIDLRGGDPARMEYVMTSHEAPGWDNVSHRWSAFKPFFFDVFGGLPTEEEPSQGETP